MQIIARVNDKVLNIVLNETQTAKKIFENLPIQAELNTWGQEIYFEIPLRLEQENPTINLKVGDVAYWPQGACFCIFFGRTPASSTDEPKPASEVTIVGHVEPDIDLLKAIPAGARIELSGRA